MRHLIDALDHTSPNLTTRRASSSVLRQLALANKPTIWGDDEVDNQGVIRGWSTIIDLYEDTEVIALAIIPNGMDLKLIASARWCDQIEGVLLFEQAKQFVPWTGAVARGNLIRGALGLLPVHRVAFRLTYASTPAQR